MVHKSPENKTTTEKTIKALVMVLIAVLLIAGGVIYLFVFDGVDKIKNLAENFGEAPTPYIIEGRVQAMQLALPENAITEQDYKDYFVKAVEFAKQNDINTIVFKGKNDMTVAWRDDNFPPLVPALQEAEMPAKAPDCLELLCEAVKGQDIQVWLEVDPYISGGYTPDMKEKAPELAVRQNGAFHTFFTPTDTAYRKILVDSFSHLPQRYAVAGVVFSNLKDFSVEKKANIVQYEQGFSQTVSEIRKNWANKNYMTKLVLSFEAGDTYVSQENVIGLSANGFIDYILPDIKQGSDLVQQLNSWTQAAKMVAVAASDTTGFVSFMAEQTGIAAGQLYGEYAFLAQKPHLLGVFKSVSAVVEPPLPAAFDIPNYLNITYPVEGKKLTWEGVYITGTSNPLQPLMLDGKEVQGRAANGAFGVFVPLEIGENSFTFLNGDTTAVKSIARVAPTAGPARTPQPDSTKELQAGSVIRVRSQIASALKNYADDGSMNETLPVGAIAVVQESVQFQSSATALSWAYRISSGDWVYAYNCDVISGTGQSAFTGLRAEEVAGGEYIHFEGTGSPAAYIAYGNDSGTLTLTMNDTSFALPAGFTSSLVQGASVEQIENKIVLTLQTSGIWGYNIEYGEGTTKLYLKRQPVLSQNPERPLEGIHVMLDPGHGDKDPDNTSSVGAPGLAGDSGYPNERHVNIALAETIAYRLRQLGAQVSFTKEGTANPTLDERLAMQNEAKPDFFISVHHDGLDGNVDLTNVNGLMAYYYHPYNTPNSKLFAENLVNYTSGLTGRPNKNARWGYYYITRTTVCPSVLFEYGFLVHPQDFDASTSVQGMYAEACATAAAIIETLQGNAAPQSVQEQPAS